MDISEGRLGKSRICLKVEGRKFSRGKFTPLVLVGTKNDLQRKRLVAKRGTLLNCRPPGRPLPRIG